jgi:hypothetical protein
MESSAATSFTANDIFTLVISVVASVGASLTVFVACFYWLRREQVRWQKRVLGAIAESGHDPEEIFLTGREAMTYGELIAQFKVNQGKQVVSVLEADGKRFIHVVGELSPSERSKMVRYLKSEGFMT